MRDSEVLASGEGAPPLEDDNVFLRAIDVLRAHGWHQGGSWGPNDSVCVARAVGLAYSQDEGVFIPRSIRDHLAHSIGVRACTDVPKWNDNPSRSVEDVVLALKEAASTWPGDRAVAEPPPLGGTHG